MNTTVFRLVMFVSFLMVLSGVVIPFLIVTKVLESTFFLNFASYATSVLGLIISAVALAFYTQVSRIKKDSDEEKYEGK